MRIYATFLLFFLLSYTHCQAQIGGENTFEFLSLPSSARITAMGGSYISCIDKDLSLAFQNPAGLNPDVHRQASFGTTAYMGKINYGHFGYAHYIPKIATFSGSVQYIAYGTVPRTDELGNQYGTFNPNEWAIQIGAGRQFAKHYSVGANLKFIASNLESYHSGGMALDLAAAYNDTARKMTATLLIRNVGVQFNPYVKGTKREPLPFDIQLGFSKRFKFVPFRISVIVHDLFRWNIRYEDPNATASTSFITDSSEITKPKKHTFDKLARHFIIGGEIYIGKPVRISFAYNHQYRAEHAFDNKKSLAGFSFGAGLHIKQFDISYGIQVFARGFTAHHFTINVNTAGFVKKKQVVKDPLEAPALLPQQPAENQ